MNENQLSAIESCIRHLSTAVSTASLYGTEHDQIKRMSKKAGEALTLAMEAESELSLIRVDDQLAVSGQPLTTSLYNQRFARMLKTHGVGHIRFDCLTSDEELYQFISALARRESKIHSTDHIRFGQVEVRYKSGNQVETKLDQQKLAGVLDEVSSEELAKIMEIYDSVKNNRNLHVVGLSEIVSEFIDIFASYADPLLSMASLRTMDEYTFTHSLNVCLLNLAQATALGIEGPLLHDIGLSAMLHDIGKLFIPAEVLNKAGKLDDREWCMMREHPVKGAEYLVNTPGVPRMAVMNAYEHHMRFDLMGYPKVSQKWEQNLCSQMTSISDIYDSLRTKRPYREPLDVNVVCENISELKGTQLHPDLVDNFLRLMKKVHPEQ